MYPPSLFKWTPSIQHLHPDCTASLCSRCQLLCLPFKGPPLATLCPGYPVARSVTRPMCGDPVISGHMLGGDTVDTASVAWRGRGGPSKGCSAQDTAGHLLGPRAPIGAGVCGARPLVGPGWQMVPAALQLSYFKMKLLLRLLVVVMPSPGLGKLA